MINPITRILATYPAAFFQRLVEQIDAAFDKAYRLTQEHYAEPERANMLGQSRHAFCEEGFRLAAQDAGLKVSALHTQPLGGRYSLVSHEGVHIIRCNVQRHCGPPRPTRFRSAWALANAWLEPLQLDLLRAVPEPSSDRLCGMLVSTAHGQYGDPRSPAFLGIGVPREDLSEWVILESINHLLGRYHDLETQTHTPPEASVDVKDQALPRLKKRPDGDQSD